MDYHQLARPDCPTCHGAGIIAGQMHGSVETFWWKDPDRVCSCVNRKHEWSYDDAGRLLVNGKVIGESVPVGYILLQPTEQVPDHEHEWVFVRTDSDWWDGDETDVYRCAVEGCTATDERYIPR